MATGLSTNAVFEFALTLAGVSQLDDRLVNELFESGCDDATLCAKSGVVTALFDREAESFRTAVVSAIRDVARAGYSIQEVSVDDGHNSADVTTSVNYALELVRQREHDPKLLEEVFAAVGVPA